MTYITTKSYVTLLSPTEIPDFGPVSISGEAHFEVTEDMKSVTSAEVYKVRLDAKGWDDGEDVVITVETTVPVMRGLHAALGQALAEADRLNAPFEAAAKSRESDERAEAGA